MKLSRFTELVGSPFEFRYLIRQRSSLDTPRDGDHKRLGRAALAPPSFFLFRPISSLVHGAGQLLFCSACLWPDGRVLFAARDWYGITQTGSKKATKGTEIRSYVTFVPGLYPDAEYRFCHKSIRFAKSKVGIFGCFRLKYQVNPTFVDDNSPKLQSGASNFIFRSALGQPIKSYCTSVVP